MAAAPGMATMGSKPTTDQMRDFLVEGVRMMESDGTRELLKTCRAAPGKKLIELQRANWDTMGVDQDIGCQTLDEIMPPMDGVDDPDNLWETKQKFVWCAMRTYLRSLDDRKPAVLEKTKPMPREVIVEFFDACNARLDLPETCENLLEMFANTPDREKRGGAIAEMQREQLETLGFERTHACALLEKIPQDFPEDRELQARLQGWFQKAQQTYVMLEQTVIARRMQDEMENNPEMKRAKEAVDKMTPEERGKCVEKNAKKVQVLMGLPSEAKQKHMKELTDDDRQELLRAQIIAFSVMKQQAAQMYSQEGGPGPGSSSGGSGAAPPQQEMM